jgi:3-isopropylmalate dehydrogenase
MRVVCLPGDRMGPEVLDAAKCVLAVLAPDVSLEDRPFGGAAILAEGAPLPEETLAACRGAEAVLLAAFGLPQLDAADVRPEQA